MKAFYEEGNSLVSVSNSILRHYGIETFHSTSKVLDEVLDHTDKKICLLLLDGFGAKIREVYQKQCKFISSGRFTTITSVFPPTTVAATTALLSSMYPCETGWLGWSQKFPDTDFDVLMFASEYNRGSKKKLPFSTWNRLSYVSLIDRINQTGRRAEKIQSFNYKNDKRHKSFFKETEKAVKANDFVYAYQTEPDKSLHVYGVGNRKLKHVIRRLDKETRKLIKKHPDTLFIVLADHGHLNTKYLNLKEYEDFYSLLSYPHLSIEPRAVPFFVKDGHKEEFYELAKKYYEKEFYILKKEEVKDSHIFGIGKECDLFDNLIGDFLFISKGESLFYEEDSHIFKSQHAGSTNDERLIDIYMFNND